MMSKVFVAGLAAMLLGAAGAVALADTFVSAVFPHGTGWTIPAYAFVASCGLFVAGALLAAVTGLWWILHSK